MTMDSRAVTGRATVSEPPIGNALSLLGELHALVRGECPRLLNEDSGGDASLALRIEDALASRAEAPGEIELWAVLGEAYGALGAAFQRVHGLPRSEDTALANRIGRARGTIERLRTSKGGALGGAA